MRSGRSVSGGTVLAGGLGRSSVLLPWPWGQVGGVHSHASED